MADKEKLRIDKELCKGCGLCVKVCPQGVLVLTDKVNERGLRYIELEHPEKCTGCGLCFTVCPDCGIEIYTDSPCS